MKLKLGALAFLFGTALASSAQASTLVQGFGLAHVGIGNMPVMGQGSPLAQFDPSLGTLQSVTLAIDNQVYFYPNPTTNSNQTSASYTLGGTFTNTIVIGGVQLAFSYTPLETGTLYGGEFRLVGIGGSATSQTTISSNFGALVGTGTVTPLSLMTGIITTYAVDPGVQLLLAPKAQFVSNGTLTYTYAEPGSPAVPEPATWMLMIGGLGIAGASMRRAGRVRLAYARI
jgi:hypothetical protein